MKALIPFFQSLIWPIFITVLLFGFGGWFQKFLDVVKKRIESGSEMSVGPSGFALGVAPKLEEPKDAASKSPQQVIEKYAKETKKETPQQETALELAKYFRLVHSASYNSTLGKQNGRPYYTIRVKLEAVSPELLHKVSKVVYHLHPTFPNPDREVTTRDNDFELETYGWGQFNLSADVYFEDGSQPLKLFRYLNF